MENKEIGPAEYRQHVVRALTQQSDSWRRFMAMLTAI